MMEVSDAIEIISTIVTAMGSWFSTIFGVFTSNGILLLLIGIPIVAFILGVIISILLRIIPKKD